MLATIKLWLSLFPAVLEAVRALEAVIPLPDQGKAKLDLILGLVQQLGADAKDFPMDKLVTGVTTMVGAIVGTLNAVGVFHKPDGAR